MINRVGALAGARILGYGRSFRFSSDFSDPYYILGLEKNADIAEVKKAFYKLANENHPDKAANNPDASNKFLLIKQAYEAIKLQKGLTKPTGFVYDTDTRSVRPDPSKFETDDEENRKSQADYRMYQERAQAAGEEYERFKGTFKTVNDINDIKIRVEKGEMKDASQRFNLENARVKIKTLKENGMAVYFIVAFAATAYFSVMLRTENKRQVREINDALQAQEVKQVKRRIFDQEEVKRQKYIDSIEKNDDMKKLIEKINKKNKQDIETGQNSA